MRWTWLWIWALLGFVCPSVEAAEYRARVVDSKSGQPLEARVYLQDGDGSWLFVEPVEPGGTALPYREQWVPMPGSVEQHTTISAHGFRVDLRPGRYRLTIERGKEYLPLETWIEMGMRPIKQDLSLVRWSDVARDGWYSGETHVHRRIEELPNVMRAEDLNVAFPVTFWTVAAGVAPTTAPSPLRPTPDPLGPRRDLGTSPVQVDDTHVFVPRNTEYEIFSVGPRRHILGAIFILNHRTRFEQGMPPVGPIARRAHEEGALLDLDKHNWPWSLMVVPVAHVDLFELANNSVWRTAFGFRSTLVAPPPWMDVERDAGGMTEWGWLNYGFQTYYTLLNCGFPLRPTAGTASGVHPVPLGYGRVYVRLNGAFRLDDWLAGLKAGRSFVTTGPMLLAQANGQDPGHSFDLGAGGARSLRITGQANSARPLERIEVVVNGAVVHRLTPKNDEAKPGGYRSPFETEIRFEESAWFALRCFERQPDGRMRFAHTGAFHVAVPGHPLRPRKREAQWLVDRMRAELDRNRAVLSAESLREYDDALATYRRLEQQARD